MSDLSGHIVGRYKITERLGEGGMAIVYKAWDTRLERDVAVKIIRPGAFTPDMLTDVLARFEREAKALARMSHPHIVKVYDYGEHEGSPYLVMEYLPGGTLKKLLGSPIPWQDAIRLLLPVARGVAYAHQHGILHRDIKPANILITENGDPMLSDFGIAKLFESDNPVALTGTGMAIGTPEYMAPEQWTGHAGPLSDQYALGIVWYEMLTARKPYQADTPAAILLKQATEPLPMPSSFAPGLPHDVEFALIKTLTRDPNERYPDINALIAAMENLLASATPYAARRPSPPDLPNRATLPPTPQAAPANTPPPQDVAARAPQRGIRPGGWMVILGVIILGCILMGSFGIYAISLGFDFRPTPRLITELPEQETPTRQPVAAAEPDETLITDTALATATQPAATPISPRWIAFQSRKNGNDDIFLVDENGENLFQLTSSPAHDRNPAWSPDGKELVYQNNEGGDMELTIINIETREIRKITENACEDWSPNWSPDGKWIVFYTNCDGETSAREIYKIRPDGSDLSQLTFTQGQTNWFPSWSPDAKRITFTSNRSGRYRIYSMDADGGSVQDLAKGCLSRYSPDGKQILYGSYCDETDALWLMNANGSNQTQLTNGYECHSATWSPDGRKIVFQETKSGQGGPYALYVMELANPDPANWFKLVDYTENGDSPAWQP